MACSLSLCGDVFGVLPDPLGSEQPPWARPRDRQLARANEIADMALAHGKGLGDVRDPDEDPFHAASLVGAR
jgi:hypothetical protein